jgi:hypothetical protein
MSWRALALVVPGTAVACTVLTHAYDWSVAPPSEGTLLCDFCPGDAGLRHAPCAAGTDPGDETTVFFAIQTVELGSDMSRWFPSNQDFAAGMDLDCSKRLPRGAPVLCQAVPGSSWEAALPNGVDNAFGEQVLAPLLLRPTPVDIDQAVTDWLRNGAGGFVVVVDHWNRQPNDAQVGFRLVQAVGPHGHATPTFTKDEQWDVYADGWDPAFPGQGVPLATGSGMITTTGYVVNGQLVADLHSAGGTELWIGAGAGPMAKIQPSSVEVLGTINASTDVSAASFDPLSVAGLIAAPDQDLDLRGLSQVVAESAVTGSGCVPQPACAQLDPLTKATFLATDMPSQPKVPKTAVCDALSFGMQLFATQIAGVAELRSPATIQSCPWSCSGTTNEAGAD